MPSTTSRKLTIKEAAAQTGLTATAIEDLINQGQFPNATKAGHAWRIPEADIEAWLKKQSSSSPTRWQRFKGQPYLFWPALFCGTLATIVLLFFAAIQLGADFGTVQDRLYQRGLARPFPPQKEGEILIVITTFHTGDETRQSTVPEALQAAIEEQVAALDIGRDIRIEIDPKIIAAGDLAQAGQLGEFHGATTIVWGTDINGRMEANFLDIIRPDFEAFAANKLPSEKERPILAAPDEYIQFVTDTAQIDFLALYAIGNAYLNTENYVQAEQVIHNVLDNFENAMGPENQTSLVFRLAFASNKLGNFEQAIIDYTRVIDRDPQHVDALTNRGSAYFSLGDYEKAIADYDQAMANNPQSLITLINRGSAFANLGEYEKALADFDRAVGLDSQSSVTFVLRGNLYVALGEYESAITDYNQALALDPQDSWALNNRGGAYVGSGEYPKAVADLSQAIALDPQLGIAFYSRANIYARLGELERAISDFSQVITLDPQFAFAFYGRGTAYDSLGEYEKAIADFNQAINLDSDNKDFYLARGVAYGNIREHESAIADFDQAIAIEPQQVVAYYNRGNAYATLGEHEKALADYDQVLALDPKFGLAFYRRALVYRELERFEEALADLQRTLELDPPPDVRGLVEQTIAEIEVQAAD